MTNHSSIAGGERSDRRNAQPLSAELETGFASLEQTSQATEGFNERLGIMNHKHGKWTEDGRSWSGDLESFARGDYRKDSGKELKGRDGPEWNDTSREWTDDRRPTEQSNHRELWKIIEGLKLQIRARESELEKSVPRINAVIVAISCLGFGLGAGFTIGWRLFG